jgi:hypothetical protein
MAVCPQPQAVLVERFVLPADAAPPYTLHLHNGGADGEARLTAARARS